ncbi:GNAT family N-acetyltransferase [Endozoicomonas sp.]|uniref:GNAT family N-acetyltransferase n=1 Tax=Endozoicomonas sp. TaxID=1892382 RepID=UPI0028863080|nr:GNAT family N-acetyltransferase [Endozoicomonas sp.]
MNLANEGETLGFVTFNENAKDKAWLDVHGTYVSPKCQKLGLGTFLVRAVTGVGLSNNKKGVEFSDPYFYGNSIFYKRNGMNMLGRCPRHRYGCAQLKLTNDDGSRNKFHPLLPKTKEYPLEFKKLKGPDPMALL